MQTKAQRILSLLKKGKDIKEIAKIVKVKPTYVYYTRWMDEQRSKKKKAKLFKSVKQADRSIKVVNDKPTDVWRPKYRMQSSVEGSFTKDSLSPLERQVKNARDFANAYSDLVKPDVVNHPPHYKAGGIETLDFIEAKDLNFRLGNVVKYVSRAGRKPDSDPLKDLEKAAFYLKREIDARKRA